MSYLFFIRIFFSTS